MQEILPRGIWTIQCTAICTWWTVTRLRLIPLLPLLAKCPDRVIYPDFHTTSEDHAAWIINLQTGRLASGVSVVHNKPCWGTGRIRARDKGSCINTFNDSSTPRAVPELTEGYNYRKEGWIIWFNYPADARWPLRVHHQYFVILSLKMVSLLVNCN
jgi:hypothetical protein